MNRQTIRRLVSEGAIGLSLCLGGYFIVVQPMQERLSAAQARADADAADAGRLQPEEMIRRAEAAARAAEQLTDMGRFSTDELTAFSGLTLLAERIGVRIEDLQQRPLSAADREQAPLSLPTERPDDEPATIRESRHAFTLAVVGRYEQIVSLLRGIETECGYARVDAVRLGPAGHADDPLVYASIDTSHWWFDASGIASNARAAADRLRQEPAE